MRLADVRERLTKVSVDGGAPRYPVREVLASVRGALFRGDKIECSCCDRTFSHFLYSPYFTARCPYCLSVERYRVLCRFLRGRSDFADGPVRVLDIAPMWWFQEFCRSYENIDYMSIDIRSPLAMRHMDIRHLDLDDASFDWIFCSHVLEHVDDDMGALRELLRVLKPGGTAIIQVPVEAERTIERRELGPVEQVELLKFPDHLRVYGPDFAEKLADAGFRVEIARPVEGLDETEVARCGLDPGEDLFVCSK